MTDYMVTIHIEGPNIGDKAIKSYLDNNLKSLGYDIKDIKVELHDGEVHYQLKPKRNYGTWGSFFD